MKKKTIAMLLIACMIMTLNLSTVFASESREEEQNDAVTMTVPEAVSKTVKDKYGNKYKVGGVSSVTGKTANVITDYKTTYYVGGKKGTVDAYKKTLTGTGKVWFYGAASNNSFTQSKTLTGGSGSFTATDSYDFTIKSEHSTHQFSCEGGSTSFYTQW